MSATKEVLKKVDDVLKVGKKAVTATPKAPSAPARVVPKARSYIAPIPTVRGQTNKSGYSAVVKAYTPEQVDVSRRVVNPAVLDKKIITPESLQGGKLVGWMGDRAQAGTVVDAINGVPLAKPVRLQGGGDWMLDSAGSIMASDDGIVSKFLGNMNKLAEGGSPVYSSHILMGEQGVDFNRMVSDMFSGGKGKVNAQTAKELNSFIKNFVVKDKDKVYTPFSDFVGINSPDFDNWLSNLSGGKRSLFIKEMDKSSKQNIGGIPDVGAIRIAVTDPQLLDAPMMSTGFAIGKFDPNVGAIDVPDIEHGTYSRQIAGSPVGTFGMQLPYETVFPDFHKMMQTQYATSRPDYIAGKKAVVQDLNQEWVDRVSKAIEEFNKMRQY